MKDANADDMLERFLQVTKSKTYAALAEALKITPQSLSDAKRKGKIPPSWAIDIAERYNVSVDWLLFGRNSTFQDELPPSLPAGASFSADIVYDVVETLEEFLQAQRRNLSPSDKAEVVRQLCQMVVEEYEPGTVRPGQLFRLIQGALSKTG